MAKVYSCAFPFLSGVEIEAKEEARRNPKRIVELRRGEFGKAQKDLGGSFGLHQAHLRLP